MAPLFTFIFLSSLAIWVGAIVFFSFIASPHVYAVWPPQQAIRAMAPMAGSYLKLGWVCGLLALGSSFFLRPIEGIYLTTRIVLVALMFFMSLYLSFGPGAQVLRVQEVLETSGESDVPKDALAGFDEFRGTASQLNGALLLLGLVVVFITSFYA